MLPYGMYLHKMYDHQKFTSVVKLKNTNLYQGLEEEDAAGHGRRKTQGSSCWKEKGRKTCARGRHLRKVPYVGEKRQREGGCQEVTVS